MAGITQSGLHDQRAAHLWLRRRFTEPPGKAQTPKVPRRPGPPDAMNAGGPRDNANGGSRNNENIRTPPKASPRIAGLGRGTAGDRPAQLGIRGPHSRDRPPAFGNSNSSSSRGRRLADDGTKKPPAEPKDRCVPGRGPSRRPANGLIVDRGRSGHQTSQGASPAESRRLCAMNRKPTKTWSRGVPS